ncbi:MAG: hypothetical protein AAGF77_06230 [Bacteroidota bacterium]
MKISSEEAYTICNKAQYNEASLWEIVKLKVHNLFSETCRKHSAKNTKLTELCRMAQLQVLDEETKAKMKAALEKHS